MPPVFLNRIGTATPGHEVHGTFRAFAEGLIADPRERRLFSRMADRAGIARRWSVLPPDGRPGHVDAEGFYAAGGFPSTRARMARWEAEAPGLAFRALDALGPVEGITHLIVASCTGFAAPGLDHAISAHLGLDETVARTNVGFMGCQAAIVALRLARDAVRADSSARVLVVNLELCTLHLQERPEVEQLLCFLLFGDGCSAALVSADPAGLRLDGFRCALLPEAEEQIAWRVGDNGFDMVLSGEVPKSLARALPPRLPALLDGAEPEAFDLWAIHPGGRSVLDAVEESCRPPQGALAGSRAVLEEHGNMSSPTVMFVLRGMLEAREAGRRGIAMAFGPGLSAETMRFMTV
ncbi:type III polyketide synthase [Roseomonas sp. SSH11]|uniref:Type III polyketide synthase n=1 Tax=Pararoseomonas baculiformis TaxID=2820812 RepID=A0ABS4AEK4_9PROT|nr:type III polyketide synthase [Pararoseomonas baculiformis]MBP0445462.1 type III polyketide synthase [Pararoseomonas baculiformis]